MLLHRASLELIKPGCDFAPTGNPCLVAGYSESHHLLCNMLASLVAVSLLYRYCLGPPFMFWRHPYTISLEGRRKQPILAHNRCVDMRWPRPLSPVASNRRLIGAENDGAQKPAICCCCIIDHRWRAGTRGPLQGRQRSVHQVPAKSASQGSALQIRERQVRQVWYRRRQTCLTAAAAYHRVSLGIPAGQWLL